MKKSENIAELAKALASFQGEVKQPFKDKANPFFKSKYVPLENVVEAISTTASKYGLSFIQFPLNQDNRVGVVTILMHSSGEWIESEPIFATPSKNDAQAIGSVITYLKRYGLSAIFGITSSEDDDGNLGANGSDRQQQGNQQQNQPPQPNRQQNQQSPAHLQPMTPEQYDHVKKVIHKVAATLDADTEVMYNGALQACKIPDKNSKLLTAKEAGMVVHYLLSLKPPA
ncbi:MAG: ERF family protein [Lysinibacillus sp.]